MRIIVDLKK